MAISTWYDAGNLGDFHRDLATNRALTLDCIQKRPVMLQHVQDCAVCQRIIAQQPSTPVAAPTAPSPAAPARRHRMRVILKPSAMHTLLGLADNHEIIFMYAEANPNVVSVLIEGADLPDFGESDQVATTEPPLPDPGTA